MSIEAATINRVTWDEVAEIADDARARLRR